jgi:PAS domain S-box-containing protein
VHLRSSIRPQGKTLIWLAMPYRKQFSQSECLISPFSWWACCQRDWQSVNRVPTYVLLAATQSLANLRALHERIVESIRSGLVTTDLNGQIYTFNKAAEEITGYQEETVRGKDASIFFGDMKGHINYALRALTDGHGSPRFETDCLTPEGLRVRLGFSISPLFSESNETTGMVITFQDLTQVRALEETSRRQDRLAAIGRMAASIAHEIRNPLAAMRGSIQMLRAEMDNDSAQTELMEIILRESDRLNRIITDFLSYARPRSLIQSRVDVGDLLHQTFSLMRHSPEILGKSKHCRGITRRPVDCPRPTKDNSSKYSGISRVTLCRQCRKVERSGPSCKGTRTIDCESHSATLAAV